MGTPSFGNMCDVTGRSGYRGGEGGEVQEDGPKQQFGTLCLDTLKILISKWRRRTKANTCCAWSRLHPYKGENSHHNYYKHYGRIQPPVRLDVVGTIDCIRIQGRSRKGSPKTSVCLCRDPDREKTEEQLRQCQQQAVQGLETSEGGSEVSHNGGEGVNVRQMMTQDEESL